MGKVRFDLRWAIRSVGAWLLIGLVLGAVFGNVMVTILESVSDPPEGLGFEMARIISPIAGALWGLVAGSIGAIVAVASRSLIAYASLMAITSVAPFGYYAYHDLVNYGHVVPVGLTAVIGITIWVIASRLNPPPTAPNANKGLRSLS